MKRRLLAALVLALSVPASANDTLLQPSPSLRVLRTVTFYDSVRTITVNRVAPPLASAPSKPAEPPLPTAQEIETQQRRAQKEHRLLFLAATVIDREVTLLRWFAEGREYRAISNIDFHLFRGLSEIETEDAVYSLYFGLGEETRDSFTGHAGWRIPTLADFSRTRSEYVLTGGEPPKADPTLTGLDALHTYFDAHRVELLDAWEKREAQRIADERWTREHPPAPPPPLILNYWPGENTVMFDAIAKGAKR